jgi:hypothetical protein
LQTETIVLLTTSMVNGAAASAWAAMRGRLRDLVARRSQAEDERLLLDSIDRFELERRETGIEPLVQQREQPAGSLKRETSSAPWWSRCLAALSSRQC